jgi:hypothetical protein
VSQNKPFLLLRCLSQVFCYSDVKMTNTHFNWFSQLSVYFKLSNASTTQISLTISTKMIYLENRKENLAFKGAGSGDRWGFKFRLLCLSGLVQVVCSTVRFVSSSVKWR